VQMEVCFSNLNHKITWNISWDIPACEHETDIESKFIWNFDVYFEPWDEKKYKKSALNIPRVSSLVKSLSLDTVLGWSEKSSPIFPPSSRLTLRFPHTENQTHKGRLFLQEKRVWRRRRRRREGKLKGKVNEERKKVDEKEGGTHMGCLDLSQTCRFLQRTCQGNLTGCAVMGTQELCCELWIIHHHLLLGFCFCVCFFHIWIMKWDW